MAAGVTVRNSGDPACASIGPFFAKSKIAGVDFGAGETAKPTSLSLGRARHLAVDQRDVLYISDTDGNRVWRVTLALRCVLMSHRAGISKQDQE